jgi:hypothetical protein
MSLVTEPHFLPTPAPFLDCTPLGYWDLPAQVVESPTLWPTKGNLAPVEAAIALAITPLFFLLSLAPPILPCWVTNYLRTQHVPLPHLHSLGVSPGSTERGQETGWWSRYFLDDIFSL